jgi:hypothetical protein
MSADGILVACPFLPIKKREGKESPLESFTFSQQVPFLPMVMRAVESLAWEEFELFGDEEPDAQMRSMASAKVLIKVLVQKSSS